MKVIFLDVDGVLNSQEACIRGKVPVFGGYITFADYLIERLVKIVAATGAKIVLSSTWRLHKYDMSSDSMYIYLEDGLERFGLDIMDITGNRRDGKRGLEIKEWLDAHAGKVEKFVAIDDDYFDIVEVFPNQTVIVNGNYGLSEINVEDAIRILNS